MFLRSIEISEWCKMCRVIMGEILGCLPLIFTPLFNIVCGESGYRGQSFGVGGYWEGGEKRAACAEQPAGESWDATGWRPIPDGRRQIRQTPTGERGPTETGGSLWVPPLHRLFCCRHNAGFRQMRGNILEKDVAQKPNILINADEHVEYPAVVYFPPWSMYWSRDFVVHVFDWCFMPYYRIFLWCNNRHRIVVAGNPVEPGENPGSFENCCQRFPYSVKTTIQLKRSS